MYLAHPFIIPELMMIIILILNAISIKGEANIRGRGRKRYGAYEWRNQFDNYKKKIFRKIVCLMEKKPRKTNVKLSRKRARTGERRKKNFLPLTRALLLWKRNCYVENILFTAIFLISGAVFLFSNNSANVFLQKQQKKEIKEFEGNVNGVILLLLARSLDWTKCVFMMKRHEVYNTRRHMVDS